MVEISCLRKSCGLCYNPLHISHVVTAGLIINMYLHTEDIDDFIDTVNILMLTNPPHLIMLVVVYVGAEVVHGVGHQYADNLL